MKPFKFFYFCLPVTDFKSNPSIERQILFFRLKKLCIQRVSFVLYFIEVLKKDIYIFYPTLKHL